MFGSRSAGRGVASSGTIEPKPASFSFSLSTSTGGMEAGTMVSSLCNALREIDADGGGVGSRGGCGSTKLERDVEALLVPMEGEKERGEESEYAEYADQAEEEASLSCPA